MLRQCKRTNRYAVSPFFSFALLTCSSFAQYGRNFDSIEWAVADADLVVSAKVADVKFERRHEDSGWLRVTLDVKETLKGRKSTRSNLRLGRMDLWTLSQSGKILSAMPFGSFLATLQR